MGPPGLAQSGGSCNAGVHTRGYPRHGQFGLTSQTRRAATSIPANIAEGQARKSTAESRRFLITALGSVAELETHIEIAKQLEYLPQEQTQSLLNAANKISRMIEGLLRSLKAQSR
ncbi:MAG: four helix bundle protein [Armatimonadota bacterium]